jgi:hypothetical protein
LGIQPASIVEPTCGRGSFLAAAVEAFPSASRIVGLEINPAYLNEARPLLESLDGGARVQLIHADFFSTDWQAMLDGLPEPILVLGNPPWVTNAHLSVLGSKNLPKKSNFQKHAGLDAITGKSNFDISEWMLIKLLEVLDGREATVAMLCKTVVARKALFHAWKEKVRISRSAIHGIDAAKHFDAAVDACFLVSTLSPSGNSSDCAVCQGLDTSATASTFGYRDGRLVADIDQHERWKHLAAKGPYRWRSGVKHDCSSVMELHSEGERYRNGYGELIELEDEYLFPMLKSSELGNGKTLRPKRYMIVTQRTTGQDTREIEARAPRTWAYLLRHADALDRRGSSIYKNRPRFSVFGVGDYTFAPWKVAISGFYKRLAFSALGPWQQKPIVLDDTSYFVACATESEGRLVAELLNSETARAFLSAHVFWDSKRPITVAVLELLDLLALSRELGRSEELEQFLPKRQRQTEQRQFLFE